MFYRFPCINQSFFNCQNVVKLPKKSNWEMIEWILICPRVLKAAISLFWFLRVNLFSDALYSFYCPTATVWKNKNVVNLAKTWCFVKTRRFSKKFQNLVKPVLKMKICCSIQEGVKRASVSCFSVVILLLHFSNFFAFKSVNATFLKKLS